MHVPDAAEVRNHWYWRPGWAVGTRFYMWYLTFADQPDVVGLASQYGPALSSQPALDVVPLDWLHVTVQGVGFVDRVKTTDVDAIVAAARRRCADLAPIELTVGAPHVDPESIQIAMQPADELRTLRATIRAAIADIWGNEEVLESAEPYNPHMSLAYVNADGPGAPLAAALATAPQIAARTTIDSCQLIVLYRDRRVYEWQPYATVGLGS